MVATAIPGIRDVLVLGKVKQLERDGAADLILVDAPATGHAITFLTSASGMVSAARGGPLRTQAQDVVELLSDPARCRVILVTLPEELPVSETIESAYTLEDKAGVQLGPVIVNACDPEPVGLDRPAAEVAAAAGCRRAAGPPGGAGGGPVLPPGPPRRLDRADRAPAPRPAPAPPAGAGARRRRPSGPTETAVLADALAEAVGTLVAGGGVSAPGGRHAGGPRAPGGATRCGAGDGRGAATLPDLVAERAVVVCCGSGRRGQDDGVGHLRPGGGAGRPPLLRRHGRPGPPAGRRPRCGVAAQHALRGAGRLARSSARTDARLQGHLRRPRPALRPHARAGRVDPRPTASTRTWPARCRARRSTWPWRSSTSWSQSERVRHRRRRHAADPQRAGPARRAAPLDPLPREPALPGPPGAHPRRCGRSAWRPRPCCAPSRRWRAPRSCRTRSAFFQAFEGMEDGFRSRASAVHELLADPDHRLRPGDLGPARRRHRSELLRREAGGARRRSGRAGGEPHCAVLRRRRAGRPRRPVPELDALEANLAALNAVADREDGSFAGAGGAGGAGPGRPHPPLRGGRARAGGAAARRPTTSSPERSRARPGRFSAAGAGPIVSPRCRPSWSPATHPPSAKR